MFGYVWCDIHAALDVLLCTSSILNICLISLDRYWSITRAVDYLKKRTPARMIMYILAVWLCSAAISIPPLLGWKKHPDMDWYYAIKDRQSASNLPMYEFMDQLYHQIGEDQFRHFTRVLEDSVFPKCQVRMAALWFSSSKTDKEQNIENMTSQYFS